MQQMALFSRKHSCLTTACSYLVLQWSAMALVPITLRLACSCMTELSEAVAATIREIDELEFVSAGESAAEAEADADETLRNNLKRWSKLRERCACDAENFDGTDPAFGGSSLQETCPICLDERGACGSSWSITACVHSGCHEASTSSISTSC